MPALASIGLGMVTTRSKGPQDYVDRPEDASQNFPAGQIITQGADGDVAIFAAPDNNLTSSGNKVLGIAVNKASGTTNALVKIRILNGNVEVRMPVWHATPGSAVTAETLVGEEYVIRNVGGVPMVAIDTSSNPVVRITDIDRDYPVGEQYGFVWVRFLSGVRVAA